MKNRKQNTNKAKIQTEKSVNKGRHEAKCTICAHAQCEEIERAFVNWGSPTQIATDFSVTRESIYRHAWALELMGKRRKNIRAALEKIIEKADSVEVNANAVVSAVAALARINSQGQWVERKETVNLNALFERMSAEELESYARDGVLPDWFQCTVGTPASLAGVSATATDSEGIEDEQ